MPFNASTSIPPLTSKVLLVTGSSSGLGQQCVLEYARHSPAKIYLAARSLTKAAAALEVIKASVPNAPVILLELDLSSLASVRTAAARVLSENDRLDVLMLNAGIMATPPALSTDGYEIQWATNHLGHALLTRLLLPLLERTAAQGNDVRIVSLTSYGHNYAPEGGIQWSSLTTEGADLGPYGRYGQSKLAQILWTRHMARLHPALTFASVHPGVVSTNLSTGATGSSWWMKMLLDMSTKVLPGPEKGPGINCGQVLRKRW